MTITKWDKDRIELSGRSVGKSTDLANELVELSATRARILFIQKFPHLAPLMYSLKLDRQPLSVGGWLIAMQHAVSYARDEHNRPVGAHHVVTDDVWMPLMHKCDGVAEDELLTISPTGRTRSCPPFRNTGRIREVEAVRSAMLIGFAANYGLIEKRVMEDLEERIAVDERDEK